MERSPFSAPLSVSVHTPVEPRIAGAAQAYTTRRVPREAMRCLVQGVAPRAGDLVLARVESLGHHTRLHLPNARRKRLFVGDEVIVAYAHRYAASQFEAVVPDSLDPCHLVAGGGIAARVIGTHQRIRRGATRIAPVGLIAMEPGGPPLNVASFALPPSMPAPSSLPTIGFIGTGMDSGKTTAAANLALGLVRSGQRVGYAKVTGTGASCDTMLLVDAGADPVLDFTDAGFASTHREAPEVLAHVARDLVGHVHGAGVDVALVEIADGVLQAETAALIEDPQVGGSIDAFVFAAGDAMGALAGRDWLEARALPLLGIAGTIESAPLLARECEAATGIPVLTRSQLCDPASARKLVQTARGIGRDRPSVDATPGSSGMGGAIRADARVGAH